MDSIADEISIQDIASVLWHRRKLIIGLSVLMGMIAMAIAFILPIRYQANVLLAPVEDSPAGKLAGAGALLSQVSGFGELGGLSLGGSSTDKSIALATLQSSALTESFIDEEGLLPLLFPNQWDAESRKWKTSGDRTPTLWEAEKKFRKTVRSVSEDKKSGLVTLTITWSDPKQAADWANELVSRTNSFLRTRAIEQSKKNLDYLNEQLIKTGVVELQRAIYALYETEIKKVMVANGSDEYAFRVVDPAQPPEERTSPRRTLITAGGIFVGLFLGILLALALDPKSNRIPA